jgi:hypothetical protein
LVLATLVIGGLALSGGAQLAKARREVDFAKSELRTARQAATSRQNEAATASLGKAQAHLDAAGRIGDSFPLGLLRPLPLLGSPSRSLAATAREMFRRQGGGEVDGILGITELATARLIGALGPLTVPGYAQPVVAEGFDERVVYEVELKFPQDQPRKKFLIALANVLFDRLLHLPGDRLPAVAEAVEESVGAGDIQLWFADEARQRQLEVSVIAGRLPAPGQDFLLVVDANLTASKANLGLRKQMDYRVRREGDRFVATLEIEARNERPTSPVNRYYNGLLRVYVPKGTKLVSPRPGQFVQPAADGPFDIVGQRILVEPEDRRVVRFDYTLPPTVAPDGDYRLRWLRQPGTPRDTLRAVVHQRTSVADPRRRVLEVSRSMDGEGITDRIRNWGPIRKLLD